MGVTPIKVVKGVSKLSQAVIPSYDESESNESIASISNNSNIETYDGSSITATVTENDDDVKNFEITPEMLERGLTEEEKYKYVAQQSYIIDSNIKPLDTSISDNNSRLEELEAIQYSADTYSNPTIYTSAQIDKRKELVVQSSGYEGSYSDLVSEINELKIQNLIFEQSKKSLEAEQANLKDNATLLTKDYKDYKETVTNVVPEDIEITTKTINESGVQYTVFNASYEDYLKAHPDSTVSSIEFYQAAMEKIQSRQSNYSGNVRVEIDMPYVADMEVLGYMKENYPQFTEVFEYLLATDSDRALKYLESNQELLTKFRGTIDAQTEIAELVKVDDEEINDFSNDFYDVDFSSKESVEEYLGRIEGLDIDNKDVIHELIKNLDYSNEQALKDGVAEIVDTVNGSIKVKNTVLNTLNITGEGLSSGAYDFFEGFEKLLMDGELTAQDYKSMIYMSYLEEHSAWYGTLYQGSSSVGNMLPTITASVVVATVAPELLPSLSATQAGAIGQNVALTLNSISSFGTIQNQLKYEGYEDWRAYLYATLSAASEFATEKWLGGLLGVSDEAGETLIKQMFNEGREEAVQNLFESGFLDTLVLGKDFDFGELTSSTIMSFIMGAGLAGVLNTYTGVLSFSINGVKYSLHGSDYKMISQLLAENPDMPYDEILKRVTGSNLELSEGASSSPSDVQDVSEDIEILDVDDSNQGSQPKSIDYYINQSQNMEESDPGSNKTCYIFDDVVLLSGDNIDPYYEQKKVILDDLKEKGVSVVRIIDKTTIDGKDYELQEKAKGEGLFPMSELLKSEDGPQIFLQTLHSISNEDIEFYEKFLLDWEALIDAGIYIDVANNQNFFYSKGEGITFIDLDLLGTGAKDLEVEKVERKRSEYFEIANMLTGSGLINKFKSVRGDAASEIKTIYQKLGMAVINTGGNIADFINQVDPSGQFGLEEYFLEYTLLKDEQIELLKNGDFSGLPSLSSLDLDRNMQNELNTIIVQNIDSIGIDNLFNNVNNNSNYSELAKYLLTNPDLILSLSAENRKKFSLSFGSLRGQNNNFVSEVLNNVDPKKIHEFVSHICVDSSSISYSKNILSTYINSMDVDCLVDILVSPYNTPQNNILINDSFIWNIEIIKGIVQSGHADKLTSNSLIVAIQNGVYEDIPKEYTVKIDSEDMPTRFNISNLLISDYSNFIQLLKGSQDCSIDMPSKYEYALAMCQMYESILNSPYDFPLTELQKQQLDEISNIVNSREFLLGAWSVSRMNRNFSREFSGYVTDEDILKTRGTVVLLDEDEFVQLLVNDRMKNFKGFNNGLNSYIDVEYSDDDSVIKSIVSHESIHQLSSKIVYDENGNPLRELSGVSFYDFATGKNYYTGINETLTEFLNELSMDDEYPQIQYCGYGGSVQRFKVLLDMNIPGLTLETLKQAYFENDISFISEPIDNITEEGFFDQYLSPALDQAIGIDPVTGEKLDCADYKALDRAVLKISLAKKGVPKIIWKMI